MHIQGGFQSIDCWEQPLNLGPTDDQPRLWFRGSVFMCIWLWMDCGDPVLFSAEIETNFSESIPPESDFSKSTYLDSAIFRREDPEIQVLFCWNDFELLNVVSSEAFQTVNMFADKLHVLEVVEMEL